MATQVIYQINPALNDISIIRILEFKQTSMFFRSQDIPGQKNISGHLCPSGHSCPYGHSCFSGNGCPPMGTVNTNVNKQTNIPAKDQALPVLGSACNDKQASNNLSTPYKQSPVSIVNIGKQSI